MKKPPNKLAYLLVPMLGAVILGVACRDQSPVAPPTVVIERPDIDLAAGGSMSGRATTTIRTFDGRSIAGSFIGADTNAFRAAIIPAGASAARMTAGGNHIDFLLAVGDNGKPARSGTWTVDGGKRNKKGPNRTLTLVAVGGAPVSEMTLRIGGETVSRVATEWARVRGGWVATARTTMLYRGGKLARSLTTTFDDPHGARIAYSRTPIATVATLSPPPRAAFDDVCDRQFYSDPGNCSPFGGGPCDAELQGLTDAVTAYWVADAAMIGCYGGLLACAGVTLYLLYTSHQIDVWDSRVDACIAGIR
jgi:hypothetical protein